MTKYLRWKISSLSAFCVSKKLSIKLNVKLFVTDCLKKKKNYVKKNKNL